MVQGQHSGAELPDLGSLAQKLEYLFQEVMATAEELGGPAAPRRPYTNKEIEQKINNASAGTPNGVTISAAYISELRRGVASDPRKSHLEALAAAFGVPTAFFVDDAITRRVQSQLKLLDQLRQMGVQQVALRQVLQQQGLSDEGTTLVEQLVKQLANQSRRLEPPPQP